METRHLVLLAMLLAGSGCAALIYEIVWFQLLELVIGSTAISLSVLIGTFMAGLCLGSVLLPRLVSRRENALPVYAFLELCIAVAAILVLYVVPPLGRAYQNLVSDGSASIFLRSLACAICLLPPTICMGATLPAASRQLQMSEVGAAWIGVLYSANTAGAMCGCLLAGFYLLRMYDMTAATFAAAAINGIVAAAALALYMVQKKGGVVAIAPVSNDESLSIPGAQSLPSPTTAGATWPVYLVIAISGFCSLSAEVVWTRVLSLLLGATVYTFSIILAVFLGALALGSAAGSALSRKYEPGFALALCQLLLTAAIAWSSYMITECLPNWPIDPFLSTNPWFTFQIDICRCALAISPAAFLWGASFSLAIAAVAEKSKDPGRVVAAVYFSNTSGAISGALACQLLLIPLLGSQKCQQLLIALSILAAIILLLAPLSTLLRLPSDKRPRTVRGRIACVMAAILIAAALMATVQPVPGLLIAFGRSIARDSRSADVIYSGEGMNSSVAISRLPGGVRNFHVSGKIEASSEPFDMKLQLMLAHLAALLHPEPKSALVVGCGSGVTAGSLLTYPTMERIVICEIEPLIPEAAAEYFKNENNNVINDARVKIVCDDARHYLATTDEKFDIITSDPIHPWVKGSATLYTRDYFEIVKRHLNKGGLVTQWVPLYESSAAVVKSEVATFLAVFGGGTVWANQKDGKGYDVVLLGEKEPSRINIDAIQARLEKPSYKAVADALARVGLPSAVDLLKTYTGREQDLAPWLADAHINLDSNLRLQYLAGMELNNDRRESIYDEMAEYRKFPEELLQGTGNKKNALRQSIMEDLRQVRRTQSMMQ